MIEPFARPQRPPGPDGPNRDLLACIEELRVARLEIELQRRCIGSLAGQLASLGPDTTEAGLLGDGDDAALATWRFDGAGNIIDASPALCDLLETPAPTNLEARPLAAMMTDRSYQHLWERLAPLDDKTAATLEIEIIGQISGRHRQVAMTVIPTMGTGTERVYAAILVNLTARRSDESCTRFLARQDSLTGLPNRAAFDEKARHALAIARRNGSLVALLCIDLDAFKAVNEAHGNATGDRVLCEIAGRLQSITRESDTLARSGGDEFAMLATNLHDPDEAEILVRRIAGRLAEPHTVPGRQLNCPASIGLALYPADGNELGTLFETAAAALHSGKRRNAPSAAAKPSRSGGPRLFLRIGGPPPRPEP